jgi:pimeloyl-ACP methyl ester carboxylesterase
MAQMMSQYGKVEYCRLAAHGYAMLAHAARANRAYRIDCPALLLCGERDFAGSTRRYNKMWHERAGLPLEWIPGAGHNSTLDAPEYVNACIEEFASQVRASQVRAPRLS